MTILKSKQLLARRSIERKKKKNGLTCKTDAAPIYPHQ